MGVGLVALLLVLELEPQFGIGLGVSIFAPTVLLPVHLVLLEWVVMVLLGDCRLLDWCLLGDYRLPELLVQIDFVKCFWIWIFVICVHFMPIKKDLASKMRA